MKLFNYNFGWRFMIIFTLALSLMAAGCKSKKKAMEATGPTAATETQPEAPEKQYKVAPTEDELANRKEKEARLDAASRLNEYFTAISSATNLASANSSIREALNLFASENAPVLIVISETNEGQRDYDRPTTIKDYLNYLKDQKKNTNVITDLEFDDNGKITSVLLVKNN
jgi:hypothetical protein